MHRQMYKNKFEHKTVQVMNHFLDHFTISIIFCNTDP
jgi:hypothetical protein